MADREIQASGRDRASLAITGLTAALLLAAMSPLTIVKIPAMLDYVNHLARMALLADGGPHPAYEVAWRLYPNLAMDLIVPALAQVFSIEVAGKLFLVLCQVLVVSGAIAIEYAVKGRHRLSGLCALAVLFSLPFAWGLMNFMFGVGVTLWGIALWIGLRERGAVLRWLVHAAVVAAIFLAHFFALGIYGLTIGLIELSKLVGRPLDLKRLAGLVAFMASPVVVVLVIMVSTGGAVGGDTIDWDFLMKLLWPLIVFNIYETWQGALTLAAVLAMAVFLAMTRRLSLNPAGIWIAAGLALLYLVLPRRLFDVAYVDVRLITVAALILPAFMTFRPPPAPWRHAPLVMLVGVILINDVSVARAWIARQSDQDAIRASFAKLARGSAVLIGRQDGAAGTNAEVQPLYYVATLAAPEAGVFVSSLYSQRGMQPVQTTPAFRDLEIGEALDNVPATVTVLRAGQDGPGADVPPHVETWTQRYRYLYLIGDAQPNPLPGRLIERARGERFVLYELARPVTP